MTEPTDRPDMHRTAGPRRDATITGGMGTCWFCARPVSGQALFCHGCGSLQPPADVDAFTRLKLQPRFDLDMADLERQATGFTRILDPARLEKRGPMERTMAERHRAGLAAAHAELRDPVSRARLLLRLEGHAGPPSGTAPAGVLGELAAAADATGVDRIANRLHREMQDALTALAVAFRDGDLARAGELVTQLEGISLAVAAGRARRAALLGPSPGF